MADNVKDNEINMSVKMETPVQDRSEEEQLEWFNGTPTRQEVTNFVTGYINNEVVPMIMSYVGRDLFNLRCMIDVLMKYVIDAGICTAEEFEQTFDEYYKLQMEQAKERQAKQAEEQKNNPTKNN